VTLHAAFFIAIALAFSGAVPRPTPESLVRIAKGHLAFGPVVLEMNVQQVEKVLNTHFRLGPTDNDIGCNGKQASADIQGYAATLVFTSSSHMRLQSITVRIPESGTVDAFVAAFRRQVPALHLELPIGTESGTPKPYWEMANDPPQHVLVSFAEHLMWIGRGCID
jgi:hypothetical protein